jgi:hypothetical protein
MIVTMGILSMKPKSCSSLIALPKTSCCQDCRPAPPRDRESPATLGQHFNDGLLPPTETVDRVQQINFRFLVISFTIFMASPKSPSSSW